MGMFGDLLGAVLGGASKPKVPTFKAIDPGAEAGKAIASNLSNLPAAENLATETSTFNQQAIQKMLEQAISGYSGITGNISKNIADLTSGKIPTDVSEQVQLSDAAKALSGGYAGSGAHGNLVARDFGLTSLQLTQQGLSAAESWITMMDQMFAPGQFNVSSMFISPQFQTETDVSERDKAWNVQWMKNQVSAMPDPMMEAVGQAAGGVLDMAASYFTGGLSSLMSSGKSKGGSSSGGGWADYKWA